VPVSAEAGNVGEAGGAGPVAGEHPAAPGVRLALPGDAHARPLKAEVDAADAGEQAANGHPNSPHAAAVFGHGDQPRCSQVW
jgi:hypothetical protein